MNIPSIPHQQPGIASVIKSCGLWILAIGLVLVGLGLLGRLAPRHEAKDYFPVENRFGEPIVGKTIR